MVGHSQKCATLLKLILKTDERIPIHSFQADYLHQCTKLEYVTGSARILFEPITNIGPLSAVRHGVISERQAKLDLNRSDITWHPGSMCNWCLDGQVYVTRLNKRRIHLIGTLVEG